MVWTVTYPNGALSVKDNRPIGNANMTYIETTMQQDHYWDEGADEDGHHKQVQMPMTGTASSPTDITLATGMDGGIFMKSKSDDDAPDNKDVMPFFKNYETVDTVATTHVMQMLGIRAMAVFEVNSGVITLKYAHNVTEANIVRTTPGSLITYQVTFTNPLPTKNYVALAGGIGSPVHMAIPTAASKTTTSISFLPLNSSNASVDPAEAWFVAFGG